MDVLSFERMKLRPDVERESKQYVKGRPIAAIKINRCPYIDMVEPFLGKAASLAGYIHAPDKYIFMVASELYEKLINLAGKEANKTSNTLNIIFRMGVYDACAPEYIKVENRDGLVIWKCCCDYMAHFKEYELPTFYFDNQQYKEALEQLKVAGY